MQKQKCNTVDATIYTTRTLNLTHLQHIQTYDFGNAVAVVIGVLGYLLEHWFSRKQSQLER